MPTTRREFVKQSAAVGIAVGGGAYLSGVLCLPRSAASIAPLRPPGALSERNFLATCIRCQRCMDACPNRALVPISLRDRHGRAGTPTMRPREAACMLCAGQDGDLLKCTEVCPSGALRLVRKDLADIQEGVHIGVAEIDFELCYSYNNWSCGACVRACPLSGRAMTIGSWERPIIHAEACVGCGCCERACIRYPHAVRVKPHRT